MICPWCGKSLFLYTRDNRAARGGGSGIEREGIALGLQYLVLCWSAFALFRTSLAAVTVPVRTLR